MFLFVPVVSHVDNIMVMPDATTPSSTPPLPTTLTECHAVIIEQSTVITQLRALITQQQATIDEQQAVLQSMQRDMALMKRALFGQRRERFDDPRQGLLFDAVVVGETKQDGVSIDDAGCHSPAANHQLFRRSVAAGRAGSKSLCRPPAILSAGRNPRSQSADDRPQHAMPLDAASVESVVSAD
jgi:uncharacterized coiled-coil protein SlyX